MKLEFYRYDFKTFEHDKSGFDTLLIDLNINNDNILDANHIINDDNIDDIDDIDNLEINCITEIITLNI